MKISPVTRPVRNCESAYTLFEIMLVLGIITVLVGSAIYLLVGQVDAAKLQRVDGDFQSISVPLSTYQMNNYKYPTTAQGLEALVTRPTTEPKPRRWLQLMKSVPLDPWGNPYVYKFPADANPNKYELLSKGPDGVQGTEDDIVADN